MKVKSILLILILIAALVGAGFLVKNNQETRSGASFANVEALFLPSEKTLKIGEKLTTTLMIDTKERLLTGADLKVKYEQSKLKLESVEVVSEGEVIVSKINQEAGIYEFVGVNTEKETSSLPKGVVSLVKLNFVAMANGQAKVSLDTNYENMITGYNEAGTDQELKVDNINSAIYTVAGVEARNTLAPKEVECSWCGEACIEKNEKEGFACPEVIPQGKKCLSQNGKCVVVDSYATE